MKKQKSIWIALSAAFLTCLLFWGCKEFNDEGTISINVQDLQEQMGISQQSSESGSVQSIQQNGVFGLLLGTVIVTSRPDPYLSDVSYDDEALDDFRDELLNSINYIGYTKLPTSKDYIEFSVPPKSAGNWQIFAVGLDFDLETFEELADDEREDAMIWMGFIEQFYTYDDVKDNKLVDQTLTLYPQ